MKVDGESCTVGSRYGGGGSGGRGRRRDVDAMFVDRVDAGRQLANAIRDRFREGEDVIVLGLPRVG